MAKLHTFNLFKLLTVSSFSQVQGSPLSHTPLFKIHNAYLVF